MFRIFLRNFKCNIQNCFKKSLGDRVTGDPKSNVDGSIIDKFKNHVEKNESSSDSLKDANNSNNDGENPGEYSLNGRPTDHRRSGDNLTPKEKMLDQDNLRGNLRDLQVMDVENALLLNIQRTTNRVMINARRITRNHARKLDKNQKQWPTRQTKKQCRHKIH